MRAFPPFFTSMTDLIITICGIIYGLILIVATFVRNAFTDAMRLDALLMPNPTDSSRLLNLFVGLLLAGYNIYSLLQ